MAIKANMDAAGARSFLSNYYQCDMTAVQPIEQGELSRAYYFSASWAGLCHSFQQQGGRLCQRTMVVRKVPISAKLHSVHSGYGLIWRALLLYFHQSTRSITSKHAAIPNSICDSGFAESIRSVSTAVAAGTWRLWNDKFGRKRHVRQLERISGVIF